MTSPFEFADGLGPEKVIEITEPRTGLRAVLVVDNTACGPAIGGCRMAPDVSVRECFRLARAMTFKNAAAGLPHGGGKSVIFADPAMEPARKEALIRAFARAIGEIGSYIVGPDMGTNETAMAWIRDEIGRSVGLPREIGGIPLDQIGATGRGVAAAAEVAQKVAGITLSGARVAVQGYGAVGRWAARFLAERGAVLVAASDSRGGVFDAEGLDLDRLDDIKRGGGSVADIETGSRLEARRLIETDCDILVPAARPDVITGDNAGLVKARLVLQGANIPTTLEAERILHERSVVVVPDFIANAGGVICASVEYHGGSEDEASTAIVEKIMRNTEETLSRSRRDGSLPRDAGMQIANDRIEKAMSFRR